MNRMEFGDDQLRAVCRQQQHRLLLELIDTANGRQWGPVPLLTLEVYAKAEFRVETVREYRLDQVHLTDNGLHVTLGDGAHQLRLGLWLKIEHGELQVRMPMTELYEDKAATYRLFSVIVLPGLLDTKGHLLMPLGAGMLCDVRKKPCVADRFLIYGEQSRWELLPMIPVGATQDSERGMMVLATEAASETECHVRTDGHGHGNLDFGMSVRQFWPDPVEFSARAIRYIPLPPAADLVHFTAKRLRRHLIEDLGKPTLTQRMAESPELRYLHDAFIMKMFFGVENQGIMMHGQPKGDPISFQQKMNFQECGDILGKMHTAGIDKVLTQAVGFNPRGHDGMWPSRFPIEERLGGEAGFRALIEHGTRLGFQMNTHDNHLSAYTCSPDFDVEQVIHDQWGQPMGLGEWGGGITYILNVLALPREWIAGQMRGLQALGMRGMAYLDGMGNPLYRDYHPRHRMSRTGYAQGVARLLEIAKEVYGAAGTECGFLYATLPADCICYTGWNNRRGWPEWPVSALMDKGVPVYLMALHGLMFIENRDENWRGTMDSVLWGGHPRTEWSAHPGIMPVADTDFIARLKAKFDLAIGQFGYLQAQEITHFCEPDTGMQQTTFSDGTVILADYNRMELWANGTQVPQPEALADPAPVEKRKKVRV